ncbi:unnamed protein product [Mytilus coruscus]|uniref:PiggyBac transposable element-derived protein domain-containing protein n=1 Tax=Mytilus coruscus TaxID=42192 RepID=A0A6J8ANE8_MYTCO|nr:unnamed protein product [Mytilus coruscus]
MTRMVMKVQKNLIMIYIPGPAGDAGNIDGWHEDFLYYEQGLPHLFTPTGRTGPTRIMPQDKSPLDFFKLFLNHVLLEMLIEQTDTYAKLQKENHPNEKKMPWVRPTIHEMNAIFGLCFEMGVDRKPSTRMLTTQQPLPGNENYDPLYKIKPLLTHFNTTFQQEYTPHRNITVDETMIPFKGRVQFKQYMAQKPHKWGVKAWVLADSQHSYIQYVDIYPGRNAIPQTHLGSSVVKRCLENSNLVG